MINLRRKPAVLIIIDGFGVAPPSRGNTIALAKTPNIDGLISRYPTVTLQAAGESVGLPWGEIGNSEVGHLAIGSGRIIFQDLPRITRSIVDGSFFENPVFVKNITETVQRGGNVHLVGMLSSAGVHSYDEHGFALMELCQRLKVPKLFLHVILDGRDCAYNSGVEFVAKLEDKIKQIGLGQIATISGRFYAMDRDGRWERTQLAYEAMVNGRGPQAATANDAIQASYAQNVYDEQLVPTVITTGGKPIGLVQANDAVLFYNYRSDRARQLTKAFTLPTFDKFTRPEYLKGLDFVTMTEYEKDLPVTIAFPPVQVTEPLGKVFSDAGLRQLRAAETEKYAHVTFFFNGGSEGVYPGEDRILVPSPMVPSYDEKPAMSEREITAKIIVALNTGKYDFAVINYAAPDMIGHTGNIVATIKAVEITDDCVGQIVDTVLAKNGLVMITADHGNAETKINSQTGEVSKEHSTNPVPLIVVANDLPSALVERHHVPMRDLSGLIPVGVLADIAPTLLSLVGLPIPASMNGHNIFYNDGV